MGALALVVAGCGTSADAGRVAYEPRAVERYLTAEVARTAQGFQVGNVACPDKLARGVGATTTCAVVLEGVTTAYVVQVLVGKRLEARPEHPLADLRKIAAQITEKAGAGAAVTCGPVSVVQMTPGQRVVCAITGVGPERRAVVTADPDGTIRVADA